MPRIYDEDEPGAELRERLAPRFGVGPVEQQHPVEVVELVLHDPRRVDPRARATPAPVASRASTCILARRSTGTRTVPSERQPSSSDSVSSPTGVTTGLTSDAVLAVERADEEAAKDPDLRRREPDAVGVVHERDHPPAHLVELLVELLDLVRTHAQHRVAVLADLRERDLLADEPLGLGLRLLLGQLLGSSSCS